MDPLSVAASIVGILTAAAKTASLINSVVSVTKRDLPWTDRLASEVNNTVIILFGLQKLCTNPDLMNGSRADLICADNLIATLTDGVLLFSDLESIAKELPSTKKGLTKRIGWVMKEKDVIAKISRLEGFKATTSAMLNRLQCESDIDAKRSQANLLLMILFDDTRLVKQQWRHIAANGGPRTQLRRQRDIAADQQPRDERGNSLLIVIEAAMFKWSWDYAG